MGSVASQETICALASGHPPSAIAIIRVSGPAVLPWLSECVPSFKEQPRMVQLLRIRDLGGAEIDRGLVCWMPSPDSYTGEDVLELMLHGGPGVVTHALDALTSFEGIRLAQAGEFTRRAFEAGKLDLTQAEGIADLIEAESRGQKDQALSQLGGALRDLYEGWHADLLRCLALLEVSVDFPDEADTPDLVDRPVLEALGGLIPKLEHALQDGELDQRIREGFRVAIIGSPNVGKSTLLNSLARREAAIVTDIPGTTRDVIEVRTRLAGQIVWFQDTAGIRVSEDPVEAEGIRRSEAVARAADIRLYLTDGASAPPLTHLRQSGDLILRTKADLGINPPLTSGERAISAKLDAGVGDLEGSIGDLVSAKVGNRSSPVLTRKRHRDAIERALSELIEARAAIEDGLGAELAAENVRLASRYLEGLVGRIDVEDVLGDVFASFCIGK
ncbi:MAG: tRNA uridine-5-carboxymethylaminomethyl(34) synthesis GTPase MnmE [Pseudomonadota bacterium]